MKVKRVPMLLLLLCALLLAAPRFAEGLLLRHTGARLPSAPHIEMTVQTLRAAGVHVETPEPGVWRVAPGVVRGQDIDVEPDLSTAAPFLAAAAATGGRVSVSGWPTVTSQAGDRMREILSTMGCQVDLTDAGASATLTVTGPPAGDLRGADHDLHDVGELTPVVAALSALATTPTRIRGVAHLRGHETDRLHAIETELTRLGGEVVQTDDGLDINPGRLHPTQVETYADHRMVMFAAVLALGVPGTEVVDAQTVAKTYPDFEWAWTRLVHDRGATVVPERGDR